VGATGATGLTGNIGATGPQGPQGPAGVTGFYWVTHQFDVPASTGDQSNAICNSGDTVYAGGSWAENGSNQVSLTQDGPNPSFNGWQSTLFNYDSTAHILHTYALCGPAPATVTVEALAARRAHKSVTARIDAVTSL